MPCEKNQKETLGRKIHSMTGLTGPADRSDRSGPTASLFEPTDLTGLTLTEQRLVFERGIFIPHTLTHSGVLMPLHSRAISEP